MFVFYKLFFTFFLANVFVPSFTSKSANRAEWGEFPFLVTFRVDGAQPARECGGSIINDEWILTSSSCIITPTEYITITAGKVNSYTNHAPILQLQIDKKHLFSHERFNPTSYENNIGLMKIQYKIEKFNKYLNSVEYSRAKQLPQHFNVTGWGDYDGDWDRYSGIKYSTFDLMENSHCTQTIALYNCSKDLTERLLSITNFCSELSDPFYAEYANLEGGPVVIRNSDGSSKQVGIVSWASALTDENDEDKSCVRSKDILVITDISQYSDWIYNIMNSASVYHLPHVLILSCIFAAIKSHL